MKIFHFPYFSVLMCGIVLNVFNANNLSYAQEQKGVIAGLFLKNSEPCSLQINIHRWDNKLYFGNTVSGKNGYYAFTNLPLGSYYLITHPVTEMPLQWRSEEVEISPENPVYIMPTIDGWSVKILSPTDGTQIELKKISEGHPLVFKWMPYSGLAEYEVEIYSTDKSQYLHSDRLTKNIFSFDGRFEDGSVIRKRIYRWELRVFPKNSEWVGTSKPHDLCIGTSGEICTYEGDYVKLEFPKWYESTIRELNLISLLDTCYLLEKKLSADQVPTLGPLPGEKQSFLYDPKIMFAYSGNPIHFGKNHINEGSFPVFITFHEMGHNFQFGGLPGFAHLLGEEYYDNTEINFGFAEGLATLASLYVTEVIDKDNLTQQARILFEQENKSMRDKFLEALTCFEDNGASRSRVTPDIISGITIRIGDKYGWETFPVFFRIFLKNDITDQIYKWAGKDNMKRTTILIAAFSVAAGTDLRDEFKNWDFPIDDRFYEKILPKVKDDLFETM